ncbi:flavodoxin family protein [Methanothermobacter wolfeii]|uniref:Flavodoxin family protein n=1 Tax=Methanothermobacter wolfeii TaxID=145261 RepID=A0ABU8TWW4_METWO|nr:flavodoxin family protein [Methanothermobacter sp. THM-1]MDI6841911.1 flavodoxin family protein [Methanothermobacter wolfeii]NLM02974.1 flavodoxin family protein [Methanothermobacter wolfeii]QHN06060.1 flavodoxin family protein [Methanothermobacter sp. THM-1]SCM56504.1 Iron-sulfur flavoprotein MJ1083 [Methanothermobacter wolfeii]
MVKVVGICGSPRKNGNTEILLREALRAAEDCGAETELIRLAGLDINPCRACDSCKKTGECAIDDDLNDVIERAASADGIIIGSPVYFGSVTAQTKMFMDRTRPLRSGFRLSDKVGGAVTVGGSRNGGQETACNDIHNFFLIHEAVVVGDTAPTAHYGGTGVGGARGDTEKDAQGLETAGNLGRKVASVAMKMK